LTQVLRAAAPTEAESAKAHLKLMRERSKPVQAAQARVALVARQMRLKTRRSAELLLAEAKLF
jgi:hypothetical protein